MITYLLAWNPKRAPWRERTELLRRIEAGQPAVTSWGMLSKSIRPGDRVFLIRLGVPPRGIIASGSAVSGAYLTPHWDPEKRRQGKSSRCVDIALSRLLDTDAAPPLSVDDLNEPPLDEMHWRIQGSGVMIPAHVAAALESRWLAHLERTGAGSSADT